MKVYAQSVTGDVYAFEEGPRLRAVTVQLSQSEIELMFRQKEDSLIRQVWDDSLGSQAKLN